jgi:hypothetical protein
MSRNDPLNRVAPLHPHSLGFFLTAVEMRRQGDYVGKNCLLREQGILAIRLLKGEESSLPATSEVRASGPLSPLSRPAT